MFAPSQDAMAEAELMVEQLITEEKAPEMEFGAVYTGRILEVSARGVMLELHPNMEPVLCHTSQLDARRVSHPSALGLEVGQEIKVKYYGRDPVSGDDSLLHVKCKMCLLYSLQAKSDLAERFSPQPRPLLLPQPAP